MKALMNLKPRLDKVHQYALEFSKENTDFYDICCDHGYLGQSLKNYYTNIHFVDPVESIIGRLKDRLGEYKGYHFHSKYGQDINIESPSSVVSICGVGGDLVISLIDSIMKRNTNIENFILCPQNRCAEVRMFLKKHFFKCLRQELVSEGQMTYEVFTVSRTKGRDFDLIGESMFENGNSSHLDYALSKKNHYQRKAIGIPKLECIADRYTQLLTHLS